MLIRDERSEDFPAISNVITTAFATMPHADGDEAELVEKLRADGALSVSLVAIEGDQLIGHISFSPVFLNDAAGPYYQLAPVSVTPERHRQGIGSELIREGLARIEAMGASWCGVLGHADYYPRFGFVHDPELTWGGYVVPNLMRIVLRGEPPKGALRFHPAFNPG